MSKLTRGSPFYFDTQTEELVVCPYDRAHVLLGHHMDRHLWKHRKQQLRQEQLRQDQQQKQNNDRPSQQQQQQPQQQQQQQQQQQPQQQQQQPQDQQNSSQENWDNLCTVSYLEYLKKKFF